MNNWYVVTGGPSSGKTTLLGNLGKKGYKILPEVARVYIDEQIGNGLSIEKIRADEKQFQDNVLKLKIETEKNLPTDELIFFDRGIPDSTAYYKYLGADGGEVLNQAVENCSYKKVFLLDMLPYVKDYARTETKEQAEKIHSLLKESYEGFTVVLVPVMSIGKRTEFILNNL